MAEPGSLQELSTALHDGRLAELLTGDGLTRRTVDALLAPGNSAELHEILDQHLKATTEVSGKLLPFRPKKAS